MSEKEEIIRYISTFINSKELIEAFKRVDRRDFLPKEVRHLAYSLKHVDDALPITKRYNTSALSLGLKMLDLLELKPNDKVLEIGTGSGYYTALIAEIVGDENVYSLENDEEVFNLALRNLKSRRVHLIFGDGSIGYPEGAPYDKAIIWAACPTFPFAIYQQLKDGGILVAPITDKQDRQGLYKIVKGKSPFAVRLFDVIFSKLTGLCGFWYS
ncbi:protein-L-isoaspartate O-methyltransferase [Sulfolobaceae archaeon RB850M]|nr:protein-L-isoaspartate O-methyltransferase [Sulfolobaceae archaeon]